VKLVQFVDYSPKARPYGYKQIEHKSGDDNNCLLLIISRIDTADYRTFVNKTTLNCLHNTRGIFTIFVMWEESFTLMLS
jgi:hypothetical protein